MNKYYNEEGKVAVLYSPEYGAGWYTWHRVRELLFDPVIVKMILDSTDDRFILANKIIAYCESTYGDGNYYGGAGQLRVEFLEPGTVFEIEEYDGSETLRTDFQPELIA